MIGRAKVGMKLRIRTSKSKPNKQFKRDSQRLAFLVPLQI